MAMLPPQYRWLKDEPAPKHLRVALSLFGIKETPGERSNPTILAWAREVGLEKVYRDDATPWCGLFMAFVMHTAGRLPAEKPLWARDWANWGTLCDGGQMLGDVMVFGRAGGGGHVGIYVGEDKQAWHILGGNQSDEVCVTRIAKNRLIAGRRPKYVNRPANIRRVFLTARGTMSINER